MAQITIKNMYKVYENKTLAIDNFNLDINKNEFVVLIGPSGCGKSTLLRMIAGLEDISYGELSIEGKVMNNVHAKDRGVAMVFQNYALYPHMTNYDNIGFALSNKRVKKSVIDEKVRHVADMLELNDYLQKKPSELSGGQRQRVALGRAMVQDSKIFLMDEPLSNLDAKLRSKMRLEILTLHKKLNITTIYVTHDQIEAMTMADKIVVIDQGIVQQIGTPKEIYYHPDNLFVARFIGDPEMNIIEGNVKDGKITVQGISFKIGEKYKAKVEKYNNDKITIGIRPEDINIFNDNNENNSNLIKSEIKLVEMRGDYSVLIMNALNTEFHVKVPSYLDLKINDTIYLSINMDKVYLFNIENGLNIMKLIK